MSHLSIRAVAFTLLAALSAPSFADPDGRGHRHGRHEHDDRHGHRHGAKRLAYTEQYLDGLCLVERKWDKHGRYKEARRCRGPAAYAPRYGVQYPVPAAVATVAPPAIVIQPPAIVIQP